MAYKGVFRARNPHKYKGDPTNIIYRSRWELMVMQKLDSHPDVVGKRVAATGVDLIVQPMGELETLVQHSGASIGVIATPADAAQKVCDRLVEAGVRSILNFAPTVLVVPDEVEIRKVDLAVELQILAFHEQRRVEDAAHLAQVMPA